MPSKNKPKSQVAVAPPAITSHLPLSEALALATVDEMAADAVAYAQSVVDDAKLEADLRVERVGGSADRVEVEDVGAQDLRSALVANAQEECTGYPPQADVPALIVPAKPAPTFLTIDPAQLVAFGWSEHSAGKIALAVHKAQEAYARLEGHGSYIPAPRLTGLALRASPVPAASGQGTAAKPSGAAVNVGPPSGVTANGQIYTAAARGNAISIYDESTRKVNGERFAYTDAGWSDFNAWLQAKRAAGARVQLKFFNDAQKARITPPADATTPPQV